MLTQVSPCQDHHAEPEEAAVEGTELPSAAWVLMLSSPDSPGPHAAHRLLATSTFPMEVSGFLGCQAHSTQIASMVDAGGATGKPQRLMSFLVLGFQDSESLVPVSALCGRPVGGRP